MNPPPIFHHDEIRSARVAQKSFRRFKILSHSISKQPNVNVFTSFQLKPCRRPFIEKFTVIFHFVHFFVVVIAAENGWMANASVIPGSILVMIHLKYAYCLLGGRHNPKSFPHAFISSNNGLRMRARALCWTWRCLFHCVSIRWLNLQTFNSSNFRIYKAKCGWWSFQVVMSKCLNTGAESSTNIVCVHQMRMHINYQNHDSIKTQQSFHKKKTLFPNNRSSSLTENHSDPEFKSTNFKYLRTKTAFEPHTSDSGC